MPRAPVDSWLAVPVPVVIAVQEDHLHVVALQAHAFLPVILLQVLAVEEDQEENRGRVVSMVLLVAAGSTYLE